MLPSSVVDRNTSPETSKYSLDPIDSLEKYKESLEFPTESFELSKRSLEPSIEPSKSLEPLVPLETIHEKHLYLTENLTEAAPDSTETTKEPPEEMKLNHISSKDNDLLYFNGEVYLPPKISVPARFLLDNGQLITSLAKDSSTNII
jgi:hypothetical protein